MVKKSDGVGIEHSEGIGQLILSEPHCISDSWPRLDRVLGTFELQKKSKCGLMEKIINHQIIITPVFLPPIMHIG